MSPSHGPFEPFLTASYGLGYPGSARLGLRLQAELFTSLTRALMCLGVWSRLGYVRNSDIRAVVVLPEVPANTREGNLAAGWDSILD